MPLIGEVYKEAERLLDRCLRHPSYNEDDLFNAVTKTANRHIRRMEELEALAEVHGWKHWVSPTW